MQDPSSRLPPALVTQRILWAAFTLSHLLFSGVFWFLHLQEPQRTLAGDPSIGYLLLAMGVTLPMLSLFAPRILQQKALQHSNAQNPAQRARLSFTPFILRVSLCEAGAILGGVALFLFGDPILWAPPAVIALLLHLAALPKLAALPAHGQSGGGRGRLAS